MWLFPVASEGGLGMWICCTGRFISRRHAFIEYFEERDIVLLIQVH